MITKTFTFESETPVTRIKLPKEYNFFELSINLKHYFRQNEITPEEYIDLLKEKYKNETEEFILIIVKPIFNDEYWKNYYVEREKNEDCPYCKQKLPAGFFNERLLQMKQSVLSQWGFNVIKEKDIYEIINK